jgi:small-conductance mechanosensitive channel
MGISYDSDVKLAKKIMREVCEKHPLIYDNRSLAEKMYEKPIVKTALTRIDESTLNIRAWAWSKTFIDSFQLRCDVNESIKERFDAEGIDLAYPYLNIILKTEKGDPVNVRTEGKTEQ